MFLYPLAISLIILSLLAPFIKNKRIYTYGQPVLTIIAAFFDLCNALPDNLKETGTVSRIIDFAKMYLPGFEYGFGWILPGLIGFAIGSLIWGIGIIMIICTVVLTL